MFFCGTGKMPGYIARLEPGNEKKKWDRHLACQKKIAGFFQIIAVVLVLEGKSIIVRKYGDWQHGFRCLYPLFPGCQLSTSGFSFMHCFLFKEVQNHSWTTGGPNTNEGSDLDGNGRVNITDVYQMRSVFGGSGPYPVAGTNYYNICILDMEKANAEAESSGRTIYEVMDAWRCDPTPGVQEWDSQGVNNTYLQYGTMLDESAVLDTVCAQRCLIGYQNDKPGTSRQAIRMFVHADGNGDGDIDIFDLTYTKKFFNKGRGPRFNPGFEQVDYDGNGWVSPAEKSLLNDGEVHCTDSDDCDLCDDDPETPFVESCL